MQTGFDLPVGYRMVSKDDLTAAVQEAYVGSFKSFAIPDALSSEEGSGSLHGRGKLTSLPMADGSDEQLLIRRYIRGGILGRFVKGIYVNVGVPRPLRELQVSDHARACGIPTPEILAAAFERIPPFFYKGAVAMREICPGADLETELLAVHSSGVESRKRKRDIVSSLGQLIAKMHAAGIYHADLHLKNTMLSERDEGMRLYVLDLDNARTCEPLSDFKKCMNLLRLYRSAEKINRQKRVITRTDLFRFLRSYAGESLQPVKQLTRRLRIMLPFWRLKWTISDAIGV